MKTVIVYYSLEGFTKKAAQNAAKRLGADLLALNPVKTYPKQGAKKFIWGGKSALMGSTPRLQPYIFDAAKYQRVVFAFPVWASSVTPPIKTFVKENKEALSGKELYALITYMGSGAERAAKKLEKQLGQPLRATAVLTDLEDKKTENESRLSEFCRVLRQ